MSVQRGVIVRAVMSQLKFEHFASAVVEAIMTHTPIKSLPGTGKHLYDIETVVDSQIAYVYVEANNRTQAAAIAKRNGYVVRSVNMTG